MLLVSYPKIGEDRLLPVYVSGIGIDYLQESVLSPGAGTPQLLFSAGGTGLLTIGGETHVLPEGSMLYLRGTSRCHCRPENGVWRTSWLTFGFGIAACADMMFLGEDWRLFDAVPNGTEERRKAMRDIYDAVSSMTPDGAYGTFRASVLLYGMLVELNRDRMGFAGKEPPKNPAMESVISYIDRNYTHDITLEQLCTAAGGLSEQYLCRLFKQSTGMRPIEYILRRRINAARAYLEKTDLPIPSIALAAGFNNTSYFYRNFRRFVNMSPLTYRQTALGLKDDEE
ncbi:MAG: helix-turn-helix domain-containing protein [Eubacteriales bacterium]